MDFSDMTEDQVLKRAAHALLLGGSYPVGSVQRNIQFAIYDECKAELDRRLLRHILLKRRERRAAQ